MDSQSAVSHFEFTALLAAVVVLSGPFGSPAAGQSAASYEVAEKSIAELQADLRADRVTSERLVELYLQRIAAYDQVGPRLNAVLAVNPNAAADARALDEERKRRVVRGPLHGIPVLIKDNFDTRDMPTTGGSLALAHVVPKGDAFQVRKLREAGAVILGKVNLHELALGLTTVSSLGGQTLNPYDVRRTAGGSSGGSGVAVAASFAAFALGSDTSGSIRIPASHTGIVGLRPTAGLSSRAGIIPFGHTQDTGGPMARTVSDVAAVLDATVGYDPADTTTAASKGRIPKSYTIALRRGALRRARVGVLTELFGTAPNDQEVAAVVRRALDDMRAQGAVIVEVRVPDLPQQLAASSLLMQELKFDLRAYLGRSTAPVKSLDELLASGLHTSQFQAFIETANALPEDYPKGEDYKRRLAARAALRRAVDGVMTANRVAALAYPTVRSIAPLVGGNQAGSNAGLAAQTGLPAISVPAGFTAAGFPVGIELLGRGFAESTLLGLAFDYEQQSRHRRPPSTTPGLAGAPPVATPPPAPAAAAAADAQSVTYEARATGAQAKPAVPVPFEAVVRFRFNDLTRQFGYDVTTSGAWQEIAGIYLHRRANRENGGVLHILSKSATQRVSGRLTLTEPEANDLRAGKFYVSVISRSGSLVSARANLVVP